MRIAYVSADHGIPLFGEKGASIHIQEMVRAFAALGHHVEVLAARVGARPISFPAGVVKVRTAATPRDASLEGQRAVRLVKEKHYQNVACAVEEHLVRAHAVQPVDLIYERYSLWSVAGVRAGSRLGIPCVVELNAPLILEQARYRKLVLADDAAAIESEVFSSATVISAVSEAVRRYAVSKGADIARTIVIPNAVDLKRFGVGVQKPDRAARERDFVIGFTGSLKAWHGMEPLLEAFRELSKQIPRCRLHIVGDGPLRAWVEGFVQGASLGEKVNITGWVPHTDMPRQLHAMDVAVAPYPALEDFYFSPLKLFEYLAAGRAIVTSAVGEITSLIEAGVSGLHCVPGDANDLARTIRRLYDDPELLHRLQDGASALASLYTWERNAKRVIEAVESLPQVSVDTGHDDAVSI